MKNNQPVTQNETAFPLERFLVSKTDLKGIITFVNDEFLNISGFSKEELIGSSHNIVRHPDMPEQAFEDLWRTIKSGQPWHGMVKNRTKNGDYYWVDAFVVPVKKNGVVNGYMSVRSAPTRDQVRIADELYQSLKNTKFPLTSSNKRATSLSVRLAMGAALASIMMLLIGLIGLNGINESNHNLEDAYHYQMEPVLALQKSQSLMNDAYKNIVLVLEHDPANSLTKVQDHSQTRHTDLVKNAISELKSARKIIEQRPANDQERPLLDAYHSATETYINEGLIPAESAVSSGRFDIATNIMQKLLPVQFEKVETSANTLSMYFMEEVAERRKHGMESYLYAVKLIIAVGISGLLTLLFVSKIQANWIRLKMQSIIHEFDSISEGVLTRSIDISRNDEFGMMNKSLAVMQTNIKVMLDNIRETVLSLQQKSADLDAQMYIVVMQSHNQQTQVNNVATTAEQFSQSVIQVASKAKDTSKIVTESQKMVVSCNESMSKSMTANAQVVVTVNDSSRIITELNQSIQKIGNVTKTIRSIADKTNLLALNAAIEAARAGEAGRGFAVVADEVRKLAESTANSTSHITSIVEEIHNFADTAVGSMQQAVTEVDLGVLRMRESMHELDLITQSSQQVTTMSQQIASVASEQSEAGVQVAGNMEQVAKTVGENVLIAQQASVISKDLLKIAERMNTLTAEFQLFVPSTVLNKSNTKDDFSSFIDI